MEICRQFQVPVDLPSVPTTQGLGGATHSLRDAMMTTLICAPLCFRHHEVHSKRNYIQITNKQTTSIRTLR